MGLNFHKSRRCSVMRMHFVVITRLLIVPVFFCLSCRDASVDITSPMVKLHELKDGGNANVQFLISNRTSGPVDVLLNEYSLLVSLYYDDTTSCEIYWTEGGMISWPPSDQHDYSKVRTIASKSNALLQFSHSNLEYIFPKEGRAHLAIVYKSISNLYTNNPARLVRQVKYGPRDVDVQLERGAAGLVAVITEVPGADGESPAQSTLEYQPPPGTGNGSDDGSD